MVWGCGQTSFAAMTSIAPSISAEPESIVAISVSWPGASTNETVRNGTAFPPQLGHSGREV